MRSSRSATVAAILALTNASPLLKRSTFTLEQVAVNKTSYITPAQALLNVYGKYGKADAAPEHVKAAAAAGVTGSATTTPQANDESYLTPVTVGSDTLNLDFDTGSSDLWVFSDKLSSSKRAGHDYYHTSASKLKSGYTWSISYGDGSGASGTVYADKVVVGGVTATSQAVEAATSISTQFSQDSNNDGLLGLAFSSINTVKPQSQTTFFDTVKSSLAQPLFAAYLKKGEPGSYDFGYVDSSKYTGTLNYIDVDSSQGFWGFTADGYSAGSDSPSGSIGYSIADTGTTLLLIPDAAVSDYYSNVSGATMDSSQGGYTFPCSADVPDFNAVIAGVTYTVPGSYINYAPIDNTGSTCFGGIQSNSGIGLSIFGDIFLKAHYVVFDSQGPSLGLAPQA